MNMRTPVFISAPSVKTALAGQQLTEYSLVIGLVGIVSVASLAAFGGTLLDTLNGTLNPFGASSSATPIAALPLTPGTNPTTALGTGNGIGGLIPAPASNEEQVCFKKGFCINVPKITEGATVKEAVGGLGGDLLKQHADILKQLVEQLKASNADPSLISAITELSLKGHTVAESLNGLESTCKVQGYDETRCLVEPDPTKIHYPTAYQDFNNYTYTIASMLNQPNVPPEVKAIVNFEIQQIGIIASGAAPTLHGDELSKQSVSVVPDNNARLTHISSNTICKTGGDTDQCVVDIDPPKG